MPPAPARGPLSNFLALGSSEVLARAAGFLATALLARRLGVEAFGILGFATAAIAYFGLALTGGFGAITAREIARSPGDAARIAADAIAVRLVLAAAGLAAVVAVSVIFVDSPARSAVLILTSLSLVPLALETSWAYRGLGRNHVIGYGLIPGQLIYLAGAWFLIQGPDDLLDVPFLQLAGDFTASAILLVVLFRGTLPRARLSRGIDLLRQSGFITVGRMLRAVIVTFDVILLGIIATDRDVGLYSAAYRVCFLAVTIAAASHAVFLPAITRASFSGAPAMSPVVGRSVHLTATVILPMAAGGIALAVPLLAFLFGPEYAAGAPAFQILLGSMALLSLHGSSHNVFVVLQRNKLEAAIFGVAAAMNVVLNLFLIPRFGLVGAASATLTSEALILAAAGIWLYRLGIKPYGGQLARAVVSAVVMGAILYPLADRAHVLLLVAAGCVFYVALLAALRGLPREFSDPVVASGSA